MWTPVPIVDFLPKISVNIEQVQDPQRNLKRVYHLTLREYKMFG